jgi:predicted nucleic acid-binding protein
VILVDTSVWVDHLRRGDGELAERLRADEVACHPFVIGELACGNLRNRSELLALLSALPAVPRVNDAEALAFIEHHRLMGRGLGLIDVHLLASCMLGGVRLWTRDARLTRAAAALNLSA